MVECETDGGCARIGCDRHLVILVELKRELLPPYNVRGLGFIILLNIAVQGQYLPIRAKVYSENFTLQTKHY